VVAGTIEVVTGGTVVMVGSGAVVIGAWVATMVVLVAVLGMVGAGVFVEKTLTDVIGVTGRVSTITSKTAAMIANNETTPPTTNARFGFWGAG
jgi:hypothetical protein